MKNLLKSLDKIVNEKNNFRNIKDKYLLKFKTGNQFIIFQYQYLNQKYCIKTDKNNNTNKHISREFKFLKLLNDKYFPKVYYEDIKNNYIVEDWVDGTLLSNISAPSLKLQIKKIIYELASIIDLLSFDKNKIIIHRDIKPKNIIYKQNSIILLDFGSAEFLGARDKSKIGISCKLGRGTHLFQPFEQLVSDIYQNHKVDVYASACIIYWILEDKLPYSNVENNIDFALKQFYVEEQNLWKTLRKYPHRFANSLFDSLRVNPEERSSNLWDCYNSYL